MHPEIINVEIIPNSLDAEQAILGSIIADASLLTRIFDRVKAEHFHTKLHQNLYSILTQMFVTGKVIDIVTVIEEAVDGGAIKERDDARSYMLKLVDTAVTPGSISTYADIVEEKYLLRRLMQIGSDVLHMASEQAEEAQKVLEYAESKIYEIRTDREVTGLSIIKPAVIEKLREIGEIAANPELANKRGLTSGFSQIDRALYGLNPGNLILIAGRPSMGKTTFAVNMATNVTKFNPGVKVAVFSLEMSRDELAGRLIAAESRVSTESLRTGNISQPEWKNLSAAADILTNSQIYVDDGANVSVGDMKSKIRRLKNVGLVVIDHLQLMSTGRKDGNRNLEVSEITRSLKLMSKELNIPVILCSQLSRGPEGRADKRPMMSELRDSGSIEQDADCVMFLYREAYYNKAYDLPNEAECIIAKNRHGFTGTVKLNFEGQFSLFTEMDVQHQ